MAKQKQEKKASGGGLLSWIIAILFTVTGTSFKNCGVNGDRHLFPERTRSAGDHQCCSAKFAHLLSTPVSSCLSFILIH